MTSQCPQPVGPAVDSCRTEMSRSVTPATLRSKVFRYLAMPCVAARPARSTCMRYSVNDCGAPPGVPASGLFTARVISDGTDVTILITVLGDTTHEPVWLATADKLPVVPSPPPRLASTTPPSWTTYW